MMQHGSSATLVTKSVTDARTRKGRGHLTYNPSESRHHHLSNPY
jgi:hypothetical protein